MEQAELVRVLAQDAELAVSLASAAVVQ